jgi:hypothetical protein
MLSFVLVILEGFNLFLKVYPSIKKAPGEWSSLRAVTSGGSAPTLFYGTTLEPDVQ